MTGLALSATPAMAFSVNPEAGSPGIGNFGDLHTILAIVAIVIVVVVNVWLIRAVRPGPRDNSTVGGGLSQGALATGLAIFALFLFATATLLSHKGRETPVSTATVTDLEQGQPLEISTTGQEWLWRYNYPNGAFSFRRLVVPTGVTVALKLRSIDVVHGWNVPSLTGKAQAVPGRTNTVYFRADEEGTHTGFSSVLSGQGYSTMQIEVDAVSPQQYESFIEQQKTDIQNAQDAAALTAAANS